MLKNDLLFKDIENIKEQINILNREKINVGEKIYHNILFEITNLSLKKHLTFHLSFREFVGDSCDCEIFVVKPNTQMFFNITSQFVKDKEDLLNNFKPELIKQFELFFDDMKKLEKLGKVIFLRNGWDLIIKDGIIKTKSNNITKDDELNELMSVLNADIVLNKSLKVKNKKIKLKM